jgi:hypothetical protein
MATKNWSDYFGESLGNTFKPSEQGTLAFNMWKEKYDTSPQKMGSQIMTYGALLGNQQMVDTGMKLMQGSSTNLPSQTAPIGNEGGVVSPPSQLDTSLPYGGVLGTRLMPKSKYFTMSNDPIAQQYGKTMATEQAKGQMAWGQTDKMIDNMISATKAAYTQAGGGGLVEGTIGNVATALRLPNTGNIQGLKTTARDTAAAYAKVLTGGSRGVLGMFNRILDTIPKDATMNPEQAGSSLAEMYLTGAAIEKGLKSGALDPEQLNKMSQSEVEAWVGANSLSSDEQTQLYKNLSTKFQAIAPRKQINLTTGEVKEPEMNSWNKMYDSMKRGFAKKTFSEEDIQYTMKKNKMTREQVLQALGK